MANFHQKTDRLSREFGNLSNVGMVSQNSPGRWFIFIGIAVSDLLIQVRTCSQFCQDLHTRPIFHWPIFFNVPEKCFAIRDWHPKDPWVHSRDMDSKALSILVTGSSGFIRTHVVRHLDAIVDLLTALDGMPP